MRSPPGPESRTSESVGIIKQVTTKPGIQAGRNVAASEEDPRYEVSNTPIYRSAKEVCELTGGLSLLKIENVNTGKLTTVFEKNILGPA